MNIHIQEPKSLFKEIDGRYFISAIDRLKLFWKYVKDNKLCASINTKHEVVDNRVITVSQVKVLDGDIELYSTTGSYSININCSSAVELSETLAIGRALGVLGFGLTTVATLGEMLRVK